MDQVRHGVPPKPCWGKGETIGNQHPIHYSSRPPSHQVTKALTLVSSRLMWPSGHPDVLLRMHTRTGRVRASNNGRQETGNLEMRQAKGEWDSNCQYTSKYRGLSPGSSPSLVVITTHKSSAGIFHESHLAQQATAPPPKTCSPLPLLGKESLSQFVCSDPASRAMESGMAGQNDTEGG